MDVLDAQDGGVWLMCCCNGCCLKGMAALPFWTVLATD